MNSEAITVPTPPLLAEFDSVSNRSFGPGNLLKEPFIALAVAQTIAQFSAIDAIYQQSLAELLPGEGAAISILLKRVRGHDSRLGLIKDLIKSKANDEDRRLFQIVEDAIKPVRDIRNRCAHGLWGRAEELKGRLLLTETTSHVQLMGASLQLFHRKFPQQVINVVAPLIFDSASPEVPSEAYNKLRELLDEAQRVNAENVEQSKCFETAEALNQKIHVWSVADAQSAVRAAIAAQHSMEACQMCLNSTEERVQPLRDALLTERLLRQPPRMYLQPVT